MGTSSRFDCLRDDALLVVRDREEVVGIARRLGFGAGVDEIVLALGRERTTEPVWITAKDLREGREFMEGMVGSVESDDKLSFESMRGGGEGSGVVGGGPELDPDAVDLIDELEDLMDGTLDGEVGVGESIGGSSICCCCCCCCCRTAEIMSEDCLTGIRSPPPSAKSLPKSEVEAEVGMVLLSDSLSESRSVATGVPRASSSALTTEIECFLIDFLLFSCAGASESLKPPFNPTCEEFFSCA